MFAHTLETRPLAFVLTVHAVITVHVCLAAYADVRAECTSEQTPVGVILLFLYFRWRTDDAEQDTITFWIS